MKRRWISLIGITALLSGAGCAIQMRTPPGTAEGPCWAICTEVVGCCICNCHADFSGAAATACALGCKIADIIIGADGSESTPMFASAEGQPARQPISLASGAAARFEAGLYSPNHNSFSQAHVRSVFFKIVRVDDYLAAMRARAPTPWKTVGKGVASDRGTFVLTFTNANPKGDYLVRTTFLMVDGQHASEQLGFKIR